MPTSLKLMFFFWQVGLVDTFSLIQFCINTGSQYGAIVVEISGNQVNVLGIGARGNAKKMNNFRDLMNEKYGLNLQY